MKAPRRPPLAPLEPATCCICDESFAARNDREVLCPSCRRAGWTGSVCDCGRPLHRRDQWSRPRRQGRCGRCRRLRLLELGFDYNAVQVRVAIREAS